MSPNAPDKKSKRKILPYNPKLKPIARELRNNMTHAETKLWNSLKQRQMMGFDFDRQRPIDQYIVDFYSKELMLAIEVDGRSHDDPKQYIKDQFRQQKLENLGVNILRFNDEEIASDVNGALDAIETWIKQNAGGQET